MSDSFADLWNQSVPAKPSQAPPKLGSPSSSNGNVPYRKANDVFAMLASAPGTSSSSRSITPSHAPSSMKPSMSASNIPANGKPIAPPLSKPTNSVGAAGSGDAFSNLISGSMAGSNSANMTIAQRAALVDSQRRDDAMRKMEASRKQSEAWAGLDTLGNGRKGPAQQQTHNLDDDWGFGASGSSSRVPVSTVSSPPAIDEDDWGLGDFGSAPSNNKQAASRKPPSQPARVQSSQSQSLWDLDEFTSPSASAPPKPKAAPRSHTNSPAKDFDFGDREDGLLGEDDDDDDRAFGEGNKYRRNDDEDDILGMLSKPVTSAGKRPSPLAQSTQTPTASNGSASRPISPPPHILGQLVEMGFMPQEARSALAATQNENGLDVQAAAELLLNGAGSREEREEPRAEPRRRARPPAKRAPSSSAPDGTRSPGEGALPVPLQEHADKLIAQASTLGLSVFNRANTLWSQGKEKAKVLYEERAASAAAAASGSGAATKRPADGRPKWMQEQDGFKDGDNEEAVPSSQPSSGPSRQKQSPVVPSQAAKPPAKTADLFADEAPKAYVSPFRRGKPTPSPTPPASASSSSGPRSAPPKTGPKPKTAQAPKPRASTPPLIVRSAISAPPAALAASLKYKTAGTEKYKLGQFGDAEAAYSQAISALPSGHLLLVPLYNNRAVARIKTGNTSGAVEDCTAVVEIIGADYHPSREKKVDSVECGSSVDLADGLVKALKRRAEAWEGREKWEEASKDWGVVAGTGWAASSAKNEGMRGAGRCRKMISSGAEGATKAAPPTKPRPTPKPSRPPARPAGPSQALTNLQEARSVQEAEDQERADLKDKVDSRLTAWKGGKENNIRALLASLETVLWPGLGWQKVSMAEVISPSQVKIRYTKAIAKLHPDKLNSLNTTVEERMIANGVFGALNDAWNVFKQ